MIEPCPFCSGASWTVESEHNPECTGERCVEPCPVPVQVVCGHCDGSGHARQPRPTARELLHSLTLLPDEREEWEKHTVDDHFVDLDHKDEMILAQTALDASALAARVERVLALHLPSLDLSHCIHCGRSWPCPTVRALNGEQP